MRNLHIWISPAEQINPPMLERAYHTSTSIKITGRPPSLDAKLRPRLRAVLPCLDYCLCGFSHMGRRHESNPRLIKSIDVAMEAASVTAAEVRRSRRRATGKLCAKMRLSAFTHII